MWLSLLSVLTVDADNSSAATASPSTRRRQGTTNSDLVRDGVSEVVTHPDLINQELDRLATVLPTMWIGTQSGRYVRRCSQFSGGCLDQHTVLVACPTESVLTRLLMVAVMDLGTCVCDCRVIVSVHKKVTS